MEEIKKLFNEFRNKRIMVIGDAIIDHVIQGTTTKISPDAPVPLVDVSNEEHSVGSLARVIEYILKMGGDIEVVSCVGNDYESDFILKYFGNLNLGIKGVYKLDSVTPKITRIISRDQQILRLEKRYTLNQETTKQLNLATERFINEVIERIDSIVIVDYDLGFLNPILISQILAIAKNYKKKVIVRPETQKYYHYSQVDLMHLNRNNASNATGITPLNETCMHIIGKKILNSVHAKGVFIPWVEGDSYYFQSDSVLRIPSLLKHRVRSHWGISSAILALLGLMSATDASLEETVKIAQIAGSLAATKDINEFFNKNELLGVIEDGKISPE